MSRKHAWVPVMLLLASLLLVGCFGEPFAEAYMARGEAEHIRDLQVATAFDTHENLRLVVHFNQHPDELRMETVWRVPDGSEETKLQVTVPSDAETMLVTYDLAKAGRTYWQPGEWQVEIRIDGKLAETLSFQVEGEVPVEEAAGAGEADEGGEADGEFDIDSPTNPFGN